MAKISTYPEPTPPALDDFIIGTDVSDSDNTKNFQISDILALGGGRALTNNTTSSLSLSTLNSIYPNSFYFIGFRVFCPNIIGGGLVYSKISSTAWVSQPITSVS